MNSIRDYINLVSETSLISEKVTLPADGSTPLTQTVNGVTSNAPANTVTSGSGGAVTSGSGAAVTSGTPAPSADAAAAAKAKLTPSQLKWLGGADATDPAIMARMPKPLPGEQVPGQAAAPAAPAAPAQAAAPVDDRNEMDKASDLAAAQAANGVNAQGQNVTMPDGTNPETGEKTQTAAAPAPAQSGQATPQTFGQAFAAARQAGQKEFEYKGKKYSTQMAPKQSGQAAPAQAPVNTNPKVGQFATNAGGAAFGNPNIAKQGAKAGATQPAPVKETSYSEDQTLASIVKLAGL